MPLLPTKLSALAALPLLLLAATACTPETPTARAAPVERPARVRTAVPIRARTLPPRVAPATALLDGTTLTERERSTLTNRPPVAVMIDNYPDARPQYGLAQAELVYEGLVEAGITRLMAVYWHGDAERIQPVRSARTQFLPLALEWGAVYAHVGSAAEEGPANAAAQILEWGIRSVDEDGSGGAIFRDPTRPAPRNAVTSTGALLSLGQTRGWGESAAVEPWPFKDDGGAAGAPVQTVDLDFDHDGLNGGAFAVRWQHDPAANRYLRFQGGAAHRDAATGDQLTARNVIVQICEVRPAGDRSGHVLYTTEGSGRALVLLDGRAVTATWRKEARAARTRYYDDTGREIALNRGTTWVEMLPAGAPLAMR